MIYIDRLSSDLARYQSENRTLYIGCKPTEKKQCNQRFFRFLEGVPEDTKRGIRHDFSFCDDLLEYPLYLSWRRRRTSPDTRIDYIIMREFSPEYDTIEEITREFWIDPCPYHCARSLRMHVSFCSAGAVIVHEIYDKGEWL